MSERSPSNLSHRFGVLCTAHSCRTIIGCLALTLATSHCCAQELTAQTATPAAHVSPFTLATYRGVPWSLEDDAKNKPVVVLAFLGTECPLAQLYAPRLAELQAEYAERGVQFVGINANVQDSVTEIAAYADRHQLTFPILKDVDNRVADAIGAQRTPEVFVLDQDRVVRYHGRIDDQYLIGVARDKPQRRDLALAIEQVLAKETVETPKTEVLGCLIGRSVRGEPKGAITYASHIADILNRRCVECHRAGDVAPFALASYDDVRGWEETILEVIDENRMPPWFANPAHGEFANDARLTSEEKALLHQWVENGMPSGDLTQAPAPPTFPEGWRMPQPDQVIYVREQPFDVPAEGIVDYQFFQVDPGWTEDKYIHATEARPGNRAVVHHIIAYVIRPEDKRRDWKRSMLVGYAPGSPPQVLREGVAIHVPAGSKLLFEMHYTPNGTAQQDHSCIGVSFLEKSQVKHQLKGRMAINTDFQIPPGDDNYQVVAEYESSRDEMLISLSPHMHLRGKSFRYEAHFPDGEHEVLLDVPHYDFNWQLRYVLSEPKLLPRDTKIICTAAFDNSTKNPVNPDAAQAVHWGEQSWEEMMIGFFDVIPTDSVTKPTAARSDDVQHEASQQSTNPDGTSAELDAGAPSNTDGHPSANNPAGVWTWNRKRLLTSTEESLTLTRKADPDSASQDGTASAKWVGVLQTNGKQIDVPDVVVEGDRVSFTVQTPELGRDVVVELSGKVDGDQLTGNIKFRVESVGRTHTMRWQATRK